MQINIAGGLQAIFKKTGIDFQRHSNLKTSQKCIFLTNSALFLTFERFWPAMWVKQRKIDGALCF